MVSEKELITRIVAGDELAFRILIDTYKEMVIRTCSNFLHHHYDAEDIAQETFIQIYCSIANFNNNSSLTTWIYKIAINNCIDYQRRQKRKKRINNFVSLFGINNSIDTILLSDSNSPESIIVNSENYSFIINAIKKLPENQRIAITLAKLEELSYKEIADIMATTIPAVEALVRRAKKNLKQFLFKEQDKLFLNN